MPLFFKIKKYINYLLQGQTKYYLHSPFVYQFYLNILEGKKEAELKLLDTLRKQLRADQTPIAIEDLGTGVKSTRTVSELESKVAIRPKYGLLLYRLMRDAEAVKVLEIGTSIGLSSAYLALGNKRAKIVSLEGSAAIAAIAENNHKQLDIGNVEIIRGDFTQTLPQALNKMEMVDLVFFDGNHTKEATLRYFHMCMLKLRQNTVFVFDDIYWNEEMCEAWEEIKRDKRVRLTIDIYQFGLCFFNHEKLAKEDFVLLY